MTRAKKKDDPCWRKVTPKQALDNLLGWIRGGCQVIRGPIIIVRDEKYPVGTTAKVAMIKTLTRRAK
jgi:hypothetical protein